jgi:hypothetical protein
MHEFIHLDPNQSDIPEDSMEAVLENFNEIVVESGASPDEVLDNMRQEFMGRTGDLFATLRYILAVERSRGVDTAAEMGANTKKAAWSKFNKAGVEEIEKTMLQIDRMYEAFIEEHGIAGPEDQAVIQMPDSVLPEATSLDDEIEAAVQHMGRAAQIQRKGES